LDHQTDVALVQIDQRLHVLIKGTEIDLNKGIQGVVGAGLGLDLFLDVFRVVFFVDFLGLGAAAELDCCVCFGVIDATGGSSESTSHPSLCIQY